jgi:hypothetical protein
MVDEEVIAILLEDGEPKLESEFVIARDVDLTIDEFVGR